MAKTPSITDLPSEAPATVFSSPVAGATETVKPDRVQRIERVISILETVVNDERANLTRFLEEDHGKDGDKAKAKVKEILALFQ